MMPTKGLPSHLFCIAVRKTKHAQFDLAKAWAHLLDTKFIWHVFGPRTAEHRVKAYLTSGEFGMSCQPVLSRSDNTPSMSSRNDGNSAPLHFDEGKPVTLCRYEGDCACGGFVVARNNGVPVGTQDEALMACLSKFVKLNMRTQSGPAPSILDCRGLKAPGLTSRESARLAAWKTNYENSRYSPPRPTPTTNVAIGRLRSSRLRRRQRSRPSPPRGPSLLLLL
jgi:hypothetical protein